MGPSRLSKTLQGITVTTLASIGGFFVWTKHCQFSPDDQFNPATEPLFRSQWFQKFNPGSNPTTHDECVRRLPLHKIRPELLEDARNGGSKLVEAFSQGVWGGFGMWNIPSHCALFVLLASHNVVWNQLLPKHSPPPSPSPLVSNIVLGVSTSQRPGSSFAGEQTGTRSWDHIQVGGSLVSRFPGTSFTFLFPSHSGTLKPSLATKVHRISC